MFPDNGPIITGGSGGLFSSEFIDVTFAFPAKGILVKKNSIQIVAIKIFFMVDFNSLRLVNESTIIFLFKNLSVIKN